MVCRRNNDEIEINCHGGQAAIAALLDSLTAAGCRRMSWQAWNRARAADPFQAAALEALAQARTRRTAAILLDQFHGALRREFEALAACLETDCLETGDARSAGERLAAPIARADLGRRLAEPFRIVLAGRPNVGKSSLINALVGYRRSIVCEQPGTTRDVVAAATAFDGWPVVLVDTAGLREVDDCLEAAGVRLAEEQLQGADLRLLVFEAHRPWTAADEQLSASWPGAMLVHNKSDLPAAACGRPTGFSTSAVTGAGIEELGQAIALRLVPQPPSPGAAVPFDSSHLAALDEAAAFLRRGDFAAAASRLRHV